MAAAPSRLVRWLRSLGLVVVIVAALAWVLPMVASFGPCRDWLADRLSARVNGKVAVGGASLGWFSAVVLRAADPVWVDRRRIWVSEPDLVVYETAAPRIVRLRLNRPEVRNAQNTRLLYELNAAFGRAALGPDAFDAEAQGAEGVGSDGFADGDDPGAGFTDGSIPWAAGAGVDPIGTARALVSNAVGGAVQGGWNWSWFCNKDFEARGTAADAMSAPAQKEQRADVWRQIFTDIQTNFAPWVPVFNERRVVAKSKRMGGPDQIYIDPTRVIDYEAIYVKG